MDVLEMIRECRNEDREPSEDKFVEGVLRADMPPRRHEGHREDADDRMFKQHLQDDRTISKYGNNEWYGEMKMLNMAHAILSKIGGKVYGELEDWINEHKAVIHDDDVQTIGMVR